MIVSNHAPVCPGAGPVMGIALRDLRFMWLIFGIDPCKKVGIVA